MSRHETVALGQATWVGIAAGIRGDPKQLNQQPLYGQRNKDELGLDVSRHPPIPRGEGKVFVS
jgi:hypothetical protein